MGQAKRRGSYEVRKEQGEKRKAELLEARKKAEEEAEASLTPEERKERVRMQLKMAQLFSLLA